MIQTLTVGATAAPAVSFNRAALTFAARNLAKLSPAQAVTLTNTGGTQLNITGIAASGDFARTTICAATLAARASCTISVTFTATAMGARTGAVTLTSNAAGSPHRIALTGTGTGKGTRHDFNGDGKADILWRNASTGQNSVWLMNGAAVTASPTSTLTAPWIIAGTGDFDGDGKADILWRNPTTGLDSIWFMNGAAATGAVTATLAASWSVAGVSDFNGDGKADITWRNLSNGATTLWLMNGAALGSNTSLSPAMAAPWSVAK